MPSRPSPSLQRSIAYCAHRAAYDEAVPYVQPARDLGTLIHQACTDRDPTVHPVVQRILDAGWPTRTEIPLQALDGTYLGTADAWDGEWVWELKTTKHFDDTPWSAEIVAHNRQAQEYTSALNAKGIVWVTAETIWPFEIEVVRVSRAELITARVTKSLAAINPPCEAYGGCRWRARCTRAGRYNGNPWWIAGLIKGARQHEDSR